LFAIDKPASPYGVHLHIIHILKQNDHGSVYCTKFVRINCILSISESKNRKLVSSRSVNHAMKADSKVKFNLKLNNS